MSAPVVGIEGGVERQKVCFSFPSPAGCLKVRGEAGVLRSSCAVLVSSYLSVSTKPPPWHPCLPPYPYSFDEEDLGPQCCPLEANCDEPYYITRYLLLTGLVVHLFLLAQFQRMSGGRGSILLNPTIRQGTLEAVAMWGNVRWL